MAAITVAVETPLEKECLICTTVKPLSEFFKRTRGADGHRCYCKKCMLVQSQANPNRKRLGRESYHRNKGKMKARSRAWAKANPELVRRRAYKKHIKEKYGLAIEQYDAMREAQGGACAICSRPFTSTPNVDHDHATGTVRALLCTPCNKGLGYFEDSIIRLICASDYVREHAKKTEQRPLRIA